MIRPLSAQLPNVLTTLASGRTDQGLIRESNQDSYALLPDKNLYLVADGLGAYRGGEVASQLAVKMIGERFDVNEGSTPDQRLAQLRWAIDLANSTIFAQACENPLLHRMSTTVAALHIGEQLFYMAHVGDSRIYRVRDENIHQLTRDHSLFNDLEAMGFDPNKYAPGRQHEITRAVGTSETVKVDLASDQLMADDLFLLCSDGLTNVLYDDAILKIVLSCGEDLEAACEELIGRANEGGGLDNITVVLTRVCKATPP